MIFMVKIEVSMPPEMQQKEKDDFRQRENDNSIQLIKNQKTSPHMAHCRTDCKLQRVGDRIR